MDEYFNMDQYLTIFKINEFKIVVRRELGKHYLDIYGSTHRRVEITQKEYKSILSQDGDGA